MLPTYSVCCAYFDTYLHRTCAFNSRVFNSCSDGASWLFDFVSITTSVSCCGHYYMCHVTQPKLLTSRLCLIYTDVTWHVCFLVAALEDAAGGYTHGTDSSHCCLSVVSLFVSQGLPDCVKHASAAFSFSVSCAWCGVWSRACQNGSVCGDWWHVVKSLVLVDVHACTCSWVLERAFHVGPLCPNAVHAARKFPSLSYVVVLRPPCYMFMLHHVNSRTNGHLVPLPWTYSRSLLTWKSFVILIYLAVQLSYRLQP